MPKSQNDDDDSRDVFEKIFDSSGVLVPAGLMIGGGVVGRALGRRAAKKAYAEQYHNIRKGELIEDQYGNTRPATQRDIEYFDDLYRGKVRMGGIGGGLTGAAIGSAAGMPIALAPSKKKRHK